MNSRLRWIMLTVLITVVCFAGLFLLSASSPPGKPAPATRTSISSAGSFIFSTPVEMIRPLSPVFFQQGGEPEIKVDVFGNIYLTAIQGVPGGVDLFKSIDKGTSFVYLGQPDGAQDHCPSLPQCLRLEPLAWQRHDV